MPKLLHTIYTLNPPSWIGVGGFGYGWYQLNGFVTWYAHSFEEWLWWLFDPYWFSLHGTIFWFSDGQNHVCRWNFHTFHIPVFNGWKVVIRLGVFSQRWWAQLVLHLHASFYTIITFFIMFWITIFFWHNHSFVLIIIVTLVCVWIFSVFLFVGEYPSVDIMKGKLIQFSRFQMATIMQIFSGAFFSNENYVLHLHLVFDIT